MKGRLNDLSFILRTRYKATRRLAVRAWRTTGGLAHAALGKDSRAFGVPRRVQRLTDYLEEDPTTVYREMYPAHDIARTYEGPLADRPHWRFRTHMKTREPAHFVLEIPGGRAVGVAGTVVGRNDAVIEEVSRETGPVEDLEIFRRVSLPPVERLPGRVALLATATPDNYYHWMMHCLPRVHLLQRAGVLDGADTLLFSKFETPFQKASLEALNLDPAKVKTAVEHPHVEAEVLLVPSVPSIDGDPTKWGVDFVRGLFGWTPGTPRRRLYISRGQAKMRRVLNEGEVEAMLANYGFETLRLEGKTVREQIDAFREAAVVVTPHGAGVTNTMFCPPGARLIEMFAPNCVSPLYWQMLEHCDVRYDYVIGVGQELPESAAPYWIRADMTLGVAELEAKVRRAIEG